MDARQQRTQSDKSRSDAESSAPVRRERTSNEHRDLVWEHRILWLLVFGILALWAYNYVMGRVDRQLRVAVLKQLSERFPRHIVSLDHAHLEHGQAILLEGLAIAMHSSQGPRTLIHAQQIQVRGNLNLFELLQGKYDLQHVRVSGLTVAVWPIDPQTWSIQTLCGDNPLPRLPPIDIVDSDLRIGRSADVRDGELVCHDVRIGIREADQHALTGLNIAFELKSSYCQRLAGRASVSHDRQHGMVEGEIAGLDVSSRLLKQLPDMLQDSLASLRGATFTTDAQFAVQLSKNQTPAYNVQGVFHQGSLKLERLPYQLEQTRGQYHCDNSAITLSNIEARSANSRFRLATRWMMPGVAGQSTARVQIENLELDRQLFDALPVALQEQWRRLQLEGRIDVQGDLLYDEGRWHPQLTVTAKNCSVEPDIFPYPLSQLCGVIHYQDGMVVTEEMTAVANGQSIVGRLTLQRAEPKWLMDLQLHTLGEVTIDDQLLGALTPRGSSRTGLERFARSLRPSGKVIVRSCQFERRADSPTELHRTMELEFLDGRIVYDGFKYPISKIHGRILIADSLLKILSMQGRNDSSSIVCNGDCICDAGSWSDLHLSFDATALPLAEELKLALPTQVRELWDQIQPTGVVEKVAVELGQASSEVPMQLKVTIDHNGVNSAQGSRALNILPASMPYAFNDVKCHVVYEKSTNEPGMVRMTEMSGVHDKSCVLAEGRCQLMANGSWDGYLKWLPGTRLIVDQNLLSTLPIQLRTPLLSVDFRGPVSIAGSTQFIISSTKSAPYARAWDLALEIEDGKIYSGNIASDIRGTVYMQGETLQDGPIAKGHLDLAGMRFRGVPITSIDGPFAIANGKLMVGRDADAVSLPMFSRDSIASARSVNNTNPVRQASSIAPVQVNSPLAPSGRAAWSNSLSPGLPSAPVVNADNEDVNQFESRNDHDIRATVFSKHDLPATVARPNGQLVLHGVGDLENGQIAVSMRMLNVDLRCMLMDLGEPSHKATGIVTGQLRLSGTPINTHTLRGVGEVHVRDAVLYELPVMVKMFNNLSLRPQDAGTFTSADVHFRIDGDTIPLDQITLDSELIRLKGEGRTNFRRELDLALRVLGGKRSIFTAVLGPGITNNDNATLAVLEVKGTIDNPKLKRMPGLLEPNLDFSNEPARDRFPIINRLSQQIEEWRAPNGQTPTLTSRPTR